MTMTHLAKPNADPMAVYELPTVPKGAPRIMGVYVETLCGVGVHRSEITTDGKPGCVLCADLLRDTLDEARHCMACGTVRC